MPQAVAELNPASLWSIFDSLTTVPRPSKKEERVRAWVLDWAREHLFETREDAAGNIVVVVPASSGRESAPIIVIQSHLDMVCEKNRGVEHDFDRDPIPTAIADGWVVAEGTTLGADNGIGVAAAMAAAIDPEITHGPLELLFTIDEETGLTGAANLDPEIVKGRILLNLDTEEDGVLCVGCAGGADTRLSLPLERADTSGTGMRLEVSGLRGGHSGMNIHENRGNAIRWCARILEDARQRDLEFKLVDVEGGDKANAIPREAFSDLRLPAAPGADWEAHLDRWRATAALELAGIDEGIQISLQPADVTQAALAPESAGRLLGLLLALPHGVLAMSPAIPGLVESSNNLASVRCEADAARLVASTRSSLAPALESVRASIRGAAELAGASWTIGDGYPGWQPNPASPVTEVLREVYTTVWGREPEVMAVHAGLECGLLGERVPGMDMISFGPTIEGAHSPDERVEIAAVERFWRALGVALDRLSS